MKRKWAIKSTKTKNEINEEYIKQNYKLKNLIAKLIEQKNFKNEEELKIFLNPTRNDFYDPFLMPDMEKAVNRITTALKNEENITIFGDYDADGITSTTILKRFFHDINKECNVYIPNRLNEGYGLNKNAIKKLSEEGTNLIITVDCGITAIEETKYAKELGIDIVITDHHEPGEEIPDAVAVVDCKRKDNKYPFRELAGCGVAFKLTQALCKNLEINENQSLKYLDIACVGTISDVVPLVDENRVIVKLGMLLLKQTKNLGLRQIINNAHFKELNSMSVAFGITPRINACGRLGHQDEALELFTTDNPEKATELAKKMDEYNQQRQLEEKRIYEEAITLLQQETQKNSIINNGQETQNNGIINNEYINQKDGNLENKNIEEESKQVQFKNKCIVLGHENWNPGVIGIVSSRITEKFYKPSILICFDKDIAKGSGRSIDGFDLHKALMECDKYLTNYGGHSLAAGLSLNTKDFEKFKSMMNTYANKNIKDEDLIPTINIDMEVDETQINVESVEELKLLEPFGQSNEEPIFMIKNLKVVSIKKLSDGKHLKLYLKNQNYIDAIGFNLGERASELKTGDIIDIVGNLNINEFNNTKKVQILLKDFKIESK